MYSFLPTIKINKFPEGTTCRQKTYTNASIFLGDVTRSKGTFSMSLAYVSADKTAV